MAGKARSPEEREAAFWAKVDKTGTCWLWRGARAGNGQYGHVWWITRLERTHRVAYELLVGPIPPGLVLDHLCRVPLCVNPAHLEPVSTRVNVVDRAIGGAGERARRTHCKAGHPFAPGSYKVSAKGQRNCNECVRRRQRESYWRNRDKRLAAMRAYDARRRSVLMSLVGADSLPA